MEIDTLSVNQEIMSRIALCGEIPFKQNINGMKSKYVADQITRMKKQKLLVPNKELNRIRLTRSGRDKLREDSERLYLHYQTLTASDITKIPVERANDDGMTNHFFIELGSHIDNIKLKFAPDSNNFGRGRKNSDIMESVLGGSSFFGSSIKFFPDKEGDLSISGMFSNLDINERYFFSNRIAKKTFDYARTSNSTNTGLYFAGGNSYVVYRQCLNRASTEASEKSIRDTLRDLHTLAYGEESVSKQLSVAPLGQCILLEPKYDGGKFTDILASYKMREAFAPRRIYSDFYIIPEENNLATYPVSVLSTPNFREKLHAAFLLSEQVQHYLTKNPQMPIYEFVTCNYSNVLKIRSVKPPEFIIVCMKWQEDLLRFLLKGYQSRMHIIIFD